MAQLSPPSFNIDLEKGDDKRPVVIQRATSSASTMPSISDMGANPKAHPLEVFQTLVGIEYLAVGGGPSVEPKQHPPKHPVRSVLLPSRIDRNRGLYDRVVANVWQNRVLYTTSNYIISGLYLLQILFAATFTALSAYKGSSSVTLTVLGAINTVVAGMLAWLKGQGMPNRFRQARDQYRDVVRQIEMAERMFAEIDYLVWPDGKRPDPIKERDRLEKLFQDARMDQVANYPDTHVSLSAKNKEGNGDGKQESAV